MTKKIFAFFLALACAWGAYEFAVQRTFVNTYSSVCDFVAEKIYLSYDKVKDWKQLCLRRSRLVTPYSPKKVILQDLNNTFDMLKVSHLEIFDANEVQDIWQGRSTETGIDGDFVESQFVVFNVQSKSPAEKAGIQKGDIIISLNDQQPSSWTAASETGLYQIQRQDEKFAVEVKQGSFQ
ncbi:MAG TPA: PDZ domain-containing protein, partial [Bdellovibrio sp.]|nr:PDZ domain-containing protein [Bdellovibrio sp.]